ncbi:MAG: LacI family DNA-binding transcriptional regulator [Clostridia bacterium]|nr:LacI family DNA-binding transcriptional regulator [Clostridia bacterium]
MKRVTQSDIAKICGVSVNTVSHALNDKPDISDEMKRNIKKTAEEMGYIHNTSASFLRSGISKSIAVIIGDISNPHFSILIKEIEEAAKASGYSAFVLNTDENEDAEMEAIISAISKNVDGIIICPVQKSDKNIKFLLKSKIPFTLIGRHFDNLDTNYVILDDEHSGYIAAKYIVERKNKKTAVLTANSYVSSARERMNGIKKYYRENSISLSDNDIYEISVSDFSHKNQMEAILEKGYDSFICFNDLMALEILSYTDREPDIVSFDNIRSKFIMPFRFASITSSKTKLSHTAVRILLDAINGRKTTSQITLPTKLS